MDLAVRANFLSPSWVYLTGITELTLVTTGLGVTLLAGSGALAGVTSFSVAYGAGLSAINQTPINPRGSSFELGSLSAFTLNNQTTIYASDLNSAHIEAFDLDATGALSSGTEVGYSFPVLAQMSEVSFSTIATTNFAISGARDFGGLALFSIAPNGQFQMVDQITDTPKSAIGNVETIQTVTVGTSDFILVASSTDEGLSTFQIDATGALSLVDTIGAKEGIWASGIDSIATVQVGATTFAVVGATNSSSLTVVRVNPMGVMFVSDHVIDHLGTRFQHVDALAAVSAHDRGFIFSGGADDGITLHEILPDGTLFLHDIQEQTASAPISNIAAIEAIVIGDEIQIFVASHNTHGLTQLAVSLQNLAAPMIGTAANDTLNGSDLDDLLIGGAGRDSLIGGGGADILIGGGESDWLFGGAGADVFIIERDGSEDRIMDFDLSEDKIDLSDWGRIYQKEALTILSRPTGADIRYGTEKLIVFSATGQSLDASDFTAENFIF